MKNKDILQCALGVHRFDREAGDCGLLCSICKRVKYYKAPWGYEYWEEYNEKGKAIHYRNSNGYAEWKEYDENGKMIHYRDSTGHKMVKSGRKT